MAFEQFLVSLPKLQIHQTASAFAEAAAPEAPGASDVVSEANANLAKARPVRATPRVGRNDLCPCGSGKKYKACCGS